MYAHESSLLASSVAAAEASLGQPLSGPLRRQMEDLFATDFQAVRIHLHDGKTLAGTPVVALAHAPHLHFAAAAYQPHTTAGCALLAHELAHVVQQGYLSNTTAGTTAGNAAACSSGRLLFDAACEKEADLAADCAAGLLPRAGMPLRLLGARQPQRAMGRAS